MDKRHRRRKGEIPPCAELQEDDQIDPRTYFDRRSPEEESLRRARMLCAQVRECLHVALGGVAEDPLLLDLCVEEVVPAPDASRLRVRLRCPNDVPLTDAKAALTPIVGRLRTEVAREIHRRRVPTLVFEILPEDAP